MAAQARAGQLAPYDPAVDVSVVIVNWNTAEMTAACLASVFESLKGAAAEVIVVDNASEDGSAEMIAARFPAAALIANGDNRGFAAANNQGFEIAHGSYVLLLNSDTLVHGDAIRQSIRYLEANADVGAMGCRVLNTDGTVQRTCGMFPTLLNQALLAAGLHKVKRPRFFGRQFIADWERDSERAVEAISGCYLLARREAMEAVGPLDEAFFFFGEETDWCRRMRDKGWRLMFAPVGEITHHGGASARKLNHRRDVLLSEALVRLHLKHGGVLAAIPSYVLIFSYNVSRAAYWSLRALFGRSRHAADRAAHFLRVIMAAPDFWPQRK
ncbi:MAG: glycosyltransferase family 2 protein [Pseudomonadota bacterium]